MPTAARLVAALLLAVLGGVVSLQVMEIMPADTAYGIFLPLNIVLGLLIGWVWLGAQPGDGSVAAISYGLTSAALLMCLGLFVQGANTMFEVSLRGRYKSAFEAIGAVFGEAVTYGQMLTVDIGLTLGIGGVIAGLCTNWAARRFN